MIKLTLLAEADNYHTKKWVTALSAYNIEILLISIGDRGEEFYDAFSNVKCLCLGVARDTITAGVWLKKLEYLKFIFRIKKAINDFDPDLVHAHFASSYGLLGALCTSRKYIVSVWGSDIYDFPKKSILHQAIIKYVFKCADQILSTSKCMRREAQKYTSKAIEITPFGVDVEKFNKKASQQYSDTLVIGTVKALYPKYGIDTLIRAFKMVKEKSALDVKLKIAGVGKYEVEYKSLTESLGLSGDVEFLGYIDNAQVPDLLNSFHVFVALSQLDSESFGVSAVEAMACGVPVVVSDVDGFKEVVPTGAGYIVARQDVNAAANAILDLLSDKEKRISFGCVGRQHVLANYDFKNNAETMYRIYCECVNN